MTKVSSAACVAAGKELLAYVSAGHIVPYTAGGMTLAGMDCQGLAEYLLIRRGVPKSECNLAGSNANWRSCVWRGTRHARRRSGPCPRRDPDDNPVKLRKSASRKESVFWLVNPGARVEKVKGVWSLVTAVCSDGYQRQAHLISKLLQEYATV